MKESTRERLTGFGCLAAFLTVGFVVLPLGMARLNAKDWDEAWLDYWKSTSALAGFWGWLIGLALAASVIMGLGLLVWALVQKMRGKAIDDFTLSTNGKWAIAFAIFFGYVVYQNHWSDSAKLRKRFHEVALELAEDITSGSGDSKWQREQAQLLLGLEEQRLEAAEPRESEDY